MKYKEPKKDKKFCPDEKCNYVRIEKTKEHEVLKCTKCGRYKVI